MNIFCKNPAWMMTTITFVFYPTFIALVSSIFKIFYDKEIKDCKTASRMLASNLLYNTPIIKCVPVFKLINQPQPDEVKLDEIKSLEVTTECIPQFILQLIIVLKLGFVSYAQMIGLSFSMASITFFAIHEIRKDVNAPIKILDQILITLMTPALVLPTLMSMVVEVTEFADHIDDRRHKVVAIVLITILVLCPVLTLWLLDFKGATKPSSSSFFRVFFLPHIFRRKDTGTWITMIHILFLVGLCLDSDIVPDVFKLCLHNYIRDISILHCGTPHAYQLNSTLSLSGISSYWTCSTERNYDSKQCIVDECQAGFLIVCDTVFGSDEACKQRWLVCRDGTGSEDLFNFVAQCVVVAQIIGYFLSRLVQFRIDEAKKKQEDSQYEARLIKVVSLSNE